MTEVSGSPLTYAQELLDELERWSPGRVSGPRSVLSAAHRVTGPVDTTVLRAALGDVVARHGALRTVVVADSTRRYQRVQPPEPATLTVTDLDTDDPPERFMASIGRLEHPSDAVPRLWAYLGRYSERDGLLVLVGHRVAVDEWSLSVLARDLVAAYTRRVRGVDPLDGAVMQYVDIAADDRSAQWQARIRRLVPYWRDRLRGVTELGLPVVPLASARRSGAPGQGPTERTATASFAVDEDLWRRVADAARRRRTTPFTVLFTAFVAEFFAGTDGAAVVPVLTPGRIPSEWETVGCLFNMLSMRLDLSGDPTAEELLRRVDATCREAYVNDIPLMPVVRQTPELAAALTSRDRVLPFFQYVPPPPVRPLVDEPAVDLAPLDVALSAMPLIPTALRWRLVGAGPVTGQVGYDPTLFDGAWVAERVNGYLHRLDQLAGFR
ncbi:condensation domain-containing protein [Micromonospora craterilacus]|uniref:condensation domain-containing protein n=1 Tax=Micromonospora craterilacus TaxID=1655439 RepID=UPI001F25E6AE|nr:condensation domain-containing protein [Micromonospora craterilacus]